MNYTEFAIENARAQAEEVRLSRSLCATQEERDAVAAREKELADPTGSVGLQRAIDALSESVHVACVERDEMRLEISRLRKRISTLESQLMCADGLLCTLGDYMQERADVRDGDEGDGPSANTEMSYERDIDWMRENIAKALA